VLNIEKLWSAGILNFYFNSAFHIFKDRNTCLECYTHNTKYVLDYSLENNTFEISKAAYVPFESLNV